MQVMIKYQNIGSFYALDSYQKNGQEKIKYIAPLQPGTYQFSFDFESTISLLPFGQMQVSSHGLYWELTETSINETSILAIRNKNKQKCVTLDIKNGKGIFIADW
jgi:thiamine pyrophosphokinase